MGVCALWSVAELAKTRREKVDAAPISGCFLWKRVFLAPLPPI